MKLGVVVGLAGVQLMSCQQAFAEDDLNEARTKVFRAFHEYSKSKVEDRASKREGLQKALANLHTTTGYLARKSSEAARAARSTKYPDPKQKRTGTDPTLSISNSPQKVDSVAPTSSGRPEWALDGKDIPKELNYFSGKENSNKTLPAKPAFEMTPSNPGSTSPQVE